MHDVPAGKVERADDLPDEAAFPAPHHMRQRRVHHDGPHGQKRAHRADFMRPATAPVTMAVVIMQKAIWNTTSTMPG